MTVQYGILTDTTKCTGCEECVKGCKTENKLGEDKPRRWKRHIDDLSSTRYTTILQKPDMRFVRQFCRHCLEPACASACIVGALTRTPEGAVVYDGDKCMGCRYCMMACPFGIPRYDWEASVPFVRKCTLCHPRISKGKKPACVEACPHEATIFGPREELLQIAHDRLEKHPDRYVDKVFGETEVGGTAILYISDIPLDFLAWKPGLDAEPLPDRTWAALSKVPPIVLGMGGLMAGIHWITARREAVKKEAAEAAATAEAERPERSESDDTSSDKKEEKDS
jgi:formate dehydrogenase iron-sulfur subunit